MPDGLPKHEPMRTDVGCLAKQELVGCAPSESIPCKGSAFLCDAFSTATPMAKQCARLVKAFHHCSFKISPSLLSWVLILMASFTGVAVDTVVMTNLLPFVIVQLSGAVRHHAIGCTNLANQVKVRI